MKPIDYLLLAALVAACFSVSMVAGDAAGLALFAVGATALWYFLGDAE